MVSNNISVWNKLIIDGSIGTLKKLHVNLKYPLRGAVYIECDDPNLGNSLKDNRLPGELKHFVPISPVVKTFQLPKARVTWQYKKKTISRNVRLCNYNGYT